MKALSSVGTGAVLSIRQRNAPSTRAATSRPQTESLASRISKITGHISPSKPVSEMLQSLGQTLYKICMAPPQDTTQITQTIASVLEYMDSLALEKPSQFSTQFESAWKRERYAQIEETDNGHLSITFNASHTANATLPGAWRSYLIETALYLSIQQSTHDALQERPFETHSTGIVANSEIPIPPTMRFVAVHMENKTVRELDYCALLSSALSEEDYIPSAEEAVRIRNLLADQIDEDDL